MGEPRVTKGKVVHITYQITDLEGNILERIDLPVGYVHGAHSDLFPQIEQRLDGCTAGDTVEVSLGPHEAFGPHRPELSLSDAVENVPPEYRRVGAEAMFQNDKGEAITMTVTEVANGRVTLDGNHPLAGKTVVFHVTVSDIRDATEDEMAKGVPEGSVQVH